MALYPCFMKTILIGLLFIPYALNAQQQYSYKKVRDIHPVGVSGNTVFLLSQEHKDWELRVYSTDAFELRKVVSLNARAGKHFRELEGVFMLDSLPAYVTSYADMARNLRVVELFRVNGDSVLPPFRLGELSMKSIPGDPDAARSLAVEWLASPNNKMIAFSLQNQEDMSRSANRVIVVYDSNFQEFSRTKLIDSGLEGLSMNVYSLKSQLRLLNSGLLVHKTVREARFYGSGTVFSAELPELSDNYDVCELQNGNLVICGLSINRESGFVVTVGQHGKGRAISMNFDYTNAPNFRLREVSPQLDGSILMIAEELRIVSIARPARTYRTNTGKTTMRAATSRSHIDKGVTRITSKAVLGQDNWVKEFQENESLPAIGQGVLVADDTKKVVVIGNFTVDDSVKAVSHVINENGDMQQLPVFQEMEEVQLLPAYSVVLNKGFILFTKEFYTYRQYSLNPDMFQDDF